MKMFTIFTQFYTHLKFENKSKYNETEYSENISKISEATRNYKISIDV